MATQGWVPPSKKATRKAREQSVSIGSPRAQTPPVDVNTPIVPATGVTGDITMHDHVGKNLFRLQRIPLAWDLLTGSNWLQSTQPLDCNRLKYI
jgi:hypothetical protein